MVGFENSVVTGHHQRLTAEQRAGNKAADEQLKTSMVCMAGPSQLLHAG